MKVLLVALAILGLAGCSSPEENEVADFTFAPVTTEAAPQYSDPNEQAYVDAVTADELIPRYGDGDSALRLGHAFCDAYGRGLSTGYIAQEISKNGTMSYTALEAFAYQAKSNLCPVFRGR